MVTHSSELASQAERIIEVANGRIVRDERSGPRVVANGQLNARGVIRREEG
jgi:ABC-type lipoprotein export system ATPase subunit